MDAELGFSQWMQQVDDVLLSEVYLTHNDLPDIDYRGLYDAGDSPREAAQMCLFNAQNT